MEPLVSVLIPMYNEEDGIRRTLNSILKQTYKNIEIIVVDDGSEDSSAKIVARDYPMVRIVQQDNRGIAVALNTGLQHCEGEFIARIDCNDESYPDRLEKQVPILLENSDIAVIGGSVMQYENDGTDLGVYRYPTTPEKFLKDLLRGNCPISHEASLIRKSILDHVGSYEPFYSGREDFELWCRISLVAKIKNIDHLVTRTLSTTEGISFREMRLAPLEKVALIERKERIDKGIGWKNEELRKKYTLNMGKARFHSLSGSERLNNTVSLFNYRARLIFLSGDRVSARREYWKAIETNKNSLHGWFGLVVTYLLPRKIFAEIFDWNRRLKYCRYLRKLNK